MLCRTGSGLAAPCNVISLGNNTKNNHRFAGAAGRSRTNLKFKSDCPVNRRMQIISKSPSNSRNMGTAIYNSVDPGPPPIPGDPSPGSWKVWIVGVLIYVVLPFLRNKWWPLQKITDKVESVMESAEVVAEIVEKVAEEVEKVADEIADNLPEGGKLKEAVTVVERIAKEMSILLINSLKSERRWRERRSLLLKRSKIKRRKQKIKRYQFDFVNFLVRVSRWIRINQHEHFT